MQNYKFHNPLTTAKGEERAWVDLKSLDTLWFNTGTLCNLACKNCYIESSPTNDRLSYITQADVETYLLEIQTHKLDTTSIGLTGGEPFINPEIISIIKSVLSYGHHILVLTNANRVLKKHQNDLLSLKEKYGKKLQLRVSLDHFKPEIHDAERGHGAFERTMEQLKWLVDNKFNISLASRSLVDETTDIAHQGHEDILKQYDISINLKDKLIIFPEMKSDKDVPEISTSCWDILSKKAEDQMCATERMIVRPKGHERPVVMPCTLLAYDKQFHLGTNLLDANKRVQLNHRFCAEFCVLGGASCSG